MRDAITIEESTGNIFKDLGFPDEEAHAELLKAQLGAPSQGLSKRSTASIARNCR